MHQQEQSEISIQIPRNPWILFMGVWMLLGSTLQSNSVAFKAVCALINVALLATWWLSRVEKVVISFRAREAIFFYSALNPVRKFKTISLREFTRVYASPFARNAGWSIHLSGPKGQHLLLARLHALFGRSMRDDAVLDICESIAKGLSIFNGGDGMRR
ncbi:hypothetical protein [Rhodoferax saidenbachensis]|uniref:PH domain-containing protein n=1 Tax=Rhodoferax saidenbachensis TaxID=1484693 RepID=A0ABU1ZK69_9BURK|nr:hypothetical protein [Rhodoferax saidenbachensis]MDR7304936.1 hypothetical protein [Rhodoferax saidenbachensis]